MREAFGQQRAVIIGRHEGRMGADVVEPCGDARQVLPVGVIEVIIVDFFAVRVWHLLGFGISFILWEIPLGEFLLREDRAAPVVVEHPPQLHDLEEGAVALRFRGIRFFKRLRNSWRRCRPDRRFLKGTNHERFLAGRFCADCFLAGRFRGLRFLLGRFFL